MSTFLYSRDQKDKVRIIIVKIVKFDNRYEIHRQTGLLDGKLTQQPPLIIREGKVKRNREQQTQLEFRSLINKQRDKGYRTFQELGFVLDVNPMNYELIDSVLPKGKEYADGSRQLMLAKDPKTVKSKAGFNWNREWLCSRKLDGIRAGVYYQDDKLTSVSRKGKCMDPAFEKIFKSTKWKTFFKKLQNESSDDIMVDGELYIHGVPLQVLSGLSQKHEYEETRHKDLEFWIFDFADTSRTADERALLLNSLQDHFPKEDNIKINQQIKLSSYETIKTMHDLWVQDGFEGAICRDASRLYGYGTRDDRMVKVKEFQEEEFEIIGLNNDNVRPEDMTFKCVTKDKVEFDSKPIGTREQKYRYIEDIDNIIGKMATVKFFNYTPDGAPFINCTKCIRDYE
jgi:hypothetical protein